MQLLAWVWLGMIIGVSFLAAPAKFMAESLTLPVALEVGRVTFDLFDRLEWLCTAALLALTWRRRRRGRLDRRMAVTITLILVIVIIQSFYFLPLLDARVGRVMAGETLEPSPLHTISGAFEVVQAAALLLLGFFAGGPDRIRGLGRSRRSKEDSMPEVEEAGAPKSLGEIMEDLESLPFEVSLMIPRGTGRITMDVVCRQVAVDDYTDREIAQYCSRRGVQDFLSRDQLEDICFNLSDQRADYSRGDLEAAIDHYWRRDAFLSLES